MELVPFQLDPSGEDRTEDRRERVRSAASTRSTPRLGADIDIRWLDYVTRLGGRELIAVINVDRTLSLARVETETADV